MSSVTFPFARGIKGFPVGRSFREARAILRESPLFSGLSPKPRVRR